MKTLLPQSIAGQLALVMAGALLAASIINYVLLLGERNRSALIELSGAPIARFVDVAADVFESPPAELGRQMRGPGRYQLARVNPVDVRDLPRDNALEERLTRALEAQGVTPTAVRASSRVMMRPERFGEFRAPGARRFPPGGPPDAPPAGQPSLPDEAMIEAREIVLAAQLPDGRWLSSFTMAPEPTRGDAFLLGASTVVTFLLVLAAALWLARRVARPLQKLALAAARVGAASKPEEVTVEGPGDVRQTLAAFNAMSRRVSQLLNEKDVMLGALGHDLRTPLASLRIRIESMEPEAERQKAIRTIEEASELLEDILELARQGRSREAERTMDLSILVQDIVEDYAEMGAKVSLASHEKAPASCRPVLLRRALRNLVDNALAYGGEARLSVTREGGEIAIRIEDSGPGMSPEALRLAADPFYRGEESRNRGTGGAGLGLTLADAIAKAHGGALILENLSPVGLAATIRLPAATLS